MKKIQDLWNESSAQVVEAEEQARSREEEREELRKRQSEVEQELSELEDTINETQRTRASKLRAGLAETASTFGDRSRYYAALQSGDLFDTKNIKEDKEAISTYEEARAEKIKELLRGAYEQALRNQEERRRAGSLEPIDAGVVLHKKGEQKLDIYFTILANSTGGLVNNLTQAVRDAVQASGVSFKNDNVEDLLRVTVEGDYQGLVQDLEKITPEGFKEANVEYTIVVLGEATRKNAEKQKGEKRPRTALQLEEVIPAGELPRNYMILDDAVAILGIHRTHCYPFLNSGELVSKKYRLPDRAKAVRAVEVESLRRLCQKRGRTFPDLAEIAKAPLEAVESSAFSIEEFSSEQETAEITYVQAPGTVTEPVLESMVSASLTVAIEVVSEQRGEQQPGPSLSQLILGQEKFAQYIEMYGAQKVEEIVELISNGITEERVEILFRADKKSSLFKGGQGLPQYVGRRNVLLCNIDSKYGSDVPSEFSFEDNPSHFLPQNLSDMEQKLEQASIKPKPLPSEEMLKKIRMSPEIARKLTDEGYHPVYVFAMLTEGFDLGKEHPLVGERYTPRRHWVHNYRRALDSVGVSTVDERAISYHERRFNGLELLYIKSKAGSHPLAFNPDWAKKTSGALKDYLSSIFPKR